MSEYSITKIVDGLFISDHFVPNVVNAQFKDIAFLKGNKIICVVGWTINQQLQYSQQDEIKSMSLSKNIAEVKFPPFSELEECFKFLQIIHQQLLCGLIYSQSQLQGALISIMYLMYRYRWNCSTAYSFVKNKMEMFEFSDEAIDGLQAFQQQLQKHYNRQLTQILWNYQFLINYHSDFDQEILLITTIKNKLRKDKYDNKIDKNNKKQKRVKWYDQIRPSSAVKISSSKNLRRASLNKSKLAFQITQPIMTQQQPNNSDLELLYQSVGYRNPSPNNFKSSQIKRSEKQNNIEQDFDFLQLKQMSRTNFNDKKYMTSKLRRKGSLKPKPPQKSQSSMNLHSINSISALVGIYSNNRPSSGKSNGMSRSGSGGLQFWNSLRNYSKNSMSNA